jgi:hypothetical protein
MVAVLVQRKSVHNAILISRETRAGSDGLCEKLVEGRRKNGNRTLSGFLSEKLVVGAKYLQQDAVVKFVGSYIIIKRRIGQHDRLKGGHERGVGVEGGKAC